MQKKIKMTSLALTAAVLMAAGSATASACSSLAIGNTTFHNCDSLSGTSTRIGNTTFHNFRRW